MKGGLAPQPPEAALLPRQTAKAVARTGSDRQVLDKEIHWLHSPIRLRRASAARFPAPGSIFDTIRGGRNSGVPWAAPARAGRHPVPSPRARAARETAP